MFFSHASEASGIHASSHASYVSSHVSHVFSHASHVYPHLHAPYELGILHAIGEGLRKAKDWIVRHLHHGSSSGGSGGGASHGSSSSSFIHDPLGRVFDHTVGKVVSSMSSYVILAAKLAFGMIAGVLITRLWIVTGGLEDLLGSRRNPSVAAFYLWALLMDIRFLAACIGLAADRLAWIAWLILGIGIYMTVKSWRDRG